MSEFWDKRAKQFLVITGVLVLLFVLLRFAKYFSDILVIVGVSILIAYLLIGPVDLLTKLVRIRAIAVMLTFVFLVSSLFLIVVFVGPRIAYEFKEFTREIPEIIGSLDKKVSDLQLSLKSSNIPLNFDTFTTTVTNKLERFTSDPLGNIVGVALSTVHIAFYILVTTVISYYFLLDSHKIIRELTVYIPEKYHIHIHNLVTELDKCLRGFYGGMIKLAAINATVMFITYLILKVPYALLLVLWHFLSCIIPVVGGWIGLVPALFVIAFTDPYKLWIPLVVYEGFTRLIKDNFITPKIMGDAIGMHPVMILIAILAGLKIAGLVGILFTLPTFGAINVILKYTLKHFSEAK